MRAGRPSKTAEHVALFRAIESRRPAGDRLFTDPLAHRFLGPRLRAVAEASALPLVGPRVPVVIDRRWPGPRESVIVRTRMIDDATVEALEGGIEQLVILGAGYDARPYRLPGADAVATFEVDHPDTQGVKRRKIVKAYGSVPAHVRFVAMEFDRDPLAETLEAAGLRADRTTMFIWEGVVSYLSEEAIDETLRWVASAGARGSRLAFTYVDSGVLEADRQSPGVQHASAWINAVSRAGEPFRTGLDARAVPQRLARHNLRLVSDESTAAALERYRPDGGGRARIPAFYRVALADTG